MNSVAIAGKALETLACLGRTHYKRRQISLLMCRFVDAEISFAIPVRVTVTDD